ncbi:MAG: S8 family serine peptidase [Candidatus Thermoplasmatota archaeon]|nr:S8 family serine peptidase [Candidatus Thermoplasmatota archaeon]
MLGDSDGQIAMIEHRETYGTFGVDDGLGTLREKEATEPENTGIEKIAVMTFRPDILHDFLAGNKVASEGPGLTQESYEMTVRILEVPASLVPDIGSLEGVVGVSEYSEPNLPMDSGGDGPAPSLDVINERHGIDSARDKGFSGQDIKIAIPDTGVDFANLDLIGTQARDATTYSTTGEIVVQSAVAGQDNATLVHKKVIPSTEALYVNGTLMPGGYTIDYDTGQVIFTPPLNVADVVTASYDYYSPYYGWPIVFDPMSVATYMKNKYPDETWFVNATQNGTDNFPVSHRIRIDGKNDFAEREQWGSDDSGEVKYQPPVGAKTTDFDLIDLFVTRDQDFWYFGFHTSMGTLNKTYGIYIDIDNATSGAEYDPVGNLVDTNASHSDSITDVQFNPNGSLIATASKDRMVKIWSKDGDLLFDLSGHLSAPHSVAWSPDGSLLATAEISYVRIWDPTTGSQIREIPIPDGTVFDGRALLSFNENGTWIAVGGGLLDRVYVLDVNDGSVIGYLKPVNGFTPNSVAFNPSFAYNDVIAIGSGDRQVYIYNVNATNLNDPAGGIPRTILQRSPINPEGHSQKIQSICWSPDGTRLASSAAETTYNVKVWDVWGANPVENLTLLFGDVRNLEWTGDMIAAGDLLGTAKVWQESGPQFVEIFSQQASQAQINGVSISPTDDKLATVAEDTQLKLWDIGTGQLEGIFKHKLPDFAIYANYTSVLWGYDEDGFPWSQNDTFMNATLYEWEGSRWNGSRLIDIGGSQKYKSLKDGDYVDSGFFEMAIPRSSLGDPPGFAIELFSVGKNGSHPHDSAPTDFNIQGDVTWDSSFRSLSNFAYRRIQIYKVNISPQNATRSVYHFGNHPGENLVKTFGTIGVLVADNRTNGTYERVYVDLNNDKVFDDTDVVLYRGNEVGYLDDFNATAAFRGDNQNLTTPDGIPDLSAGMVYFISDGETYIPYSDVYCEDNLIEDCIVPKNGELVAFAGELGFQKYHGTRMASAIVGQGRLDTDLGDPDIGRVLGIAPNATIIMIPNAFDNIFAAWSFAVEGYDGVPDSGDEADIVINGFNYARLLNSGWDVFSRFADWASVKRSGASTVFVTAAGNDGFGYGTINSPSSATAVITAGVATDYTRDSSAYASYGAKEGSNPKWGDVMPYSSKGPTPMGIPKPDVVTIGVANVDDPLWRGPDGSNMTALKLGLFEGSHVSAAITGGVVALIYEAFYSTHLRFPTVQEAKAILKSSADNINHDVLSQGAGFVNASRAVDLAANVGGIVVDPTYWVPGFYAGGKPEAFAKLMFPGESDSIDFTVENTDLTSSVSVQASDEVFKKTATYYTDGVTRTDSWYSTDGRLTYWINDTGLTKILPDPFQWNTYTLVQTPIDAGLWNSADLMKVTAWSNFTDIDTDDNGMIKRESQDPVMILELRDWENIDVWPNWNYPDTIMQQTETNTFTRCNNVANVLETTVHDPASRIHDALIINLKPTPTKLDEGQYWKLKIEFFERFDWDWLSLDSTSFTIPVGGTQDLTATMTLPPDVGIGSYEGGIYLDANGLVSVIPVLVNVASRETRFTFGGFSSISQDLFNNTKIGGGMGGGFEGDLERSGDWRYFYIDVPRQGKFIDPYNYKFYIDVSWNLKPSDIDIHAFGKDPAPAYADYFSDSSRYGGYTLSETGASEDDDEFNTVTNTSQEIITPPLRPGLNVIALHCVMFNGTQEPEENVSGQVGWVEITPVELRKVTNQLSGEARMTFTSNFDWPMGMETSAVGPAQMERFDDVEIFFDKKIVEELYAGERTFVEGLADGNYTYVVRVKDALIFDVHIWGKADAPDLDLGIFLDANGNGEAEPGEFVEYGADADADEQVKLKAPKDGQYIIKVLGFDTRDPGHFDIEISVTIAGIEGYKMVDAPEGPITANTPLNFGMSWEFMGDTEDRDYGGVLTLGPPGASEAVLIPVTITLDRTPPSMGDLVMSTGEKQVNYLDNRTTNQIQPQFSVAVLDLERGEIDPGLCAVYFDGEDSTSWSTIDIKFVRNAEDAYGYWAGGILYSPVAPLSEGVHNITFVTGDAAGNLIIRDFIIVVDTQSPPLVLDQPTTMHTQVSEVTVSGTTEALATVFVRSEMLTAGPDGRFKTTITLVNGTNFIQVRVVDWFGLTASGDLVSANDNSATIEIVSDSVSPTIGRIDYPAVTNSEFAVFSGLVDDLVSQLPEEHLDLDMLSLRIAGIDVPVQSDGSFYAVIPLPLEGENNITFLLSDPAGNTASDSRLVTRDTTPPALTLESVPETTTSNTVRVRGTAEAGSTVTINGRFLQTELDGSFSEDVTLSWGPNIIIVESTDEAGNVQTAMRVVSYGPAPSLIPWMVAVLLLVVGLVIGYLFSTRMRPEEKEELEDLDEELEEELQELEEMGEEPEELEEPPEEDIEEAEKIEVREEEPLEELEPEEPEPVEEPPAEEEPPETPPEEDPRLERLRKAYDEGKISKEVYEENLRKITGE